MADRIKGITVNSLTTENKTKLKTYFVQGTGLSNFLV